MRTTADSEQVLIDHGHKVGLHCVALKPVDVIELEASRVTYSDWRQRHETVCFPAAEDIR
jgi:hypothetical protein